MTDTNKLIGATINDRYRIVELIGKGGSGHVYKATNLQDKSIVAIKILKGVSADDPESVIRFEKEVAVSAKLTNPHTVRTYEFGKTTEGYMVIVMEFLEGQPLTHFIDSESPLSPRRAVSIVRQVLQALAEAHRVGIVHRDLKPDNIFIQPGDDGMDFVKVLDFGIAKFLHDDSVGDTLSRDGFIFGTPLYISPEQALGWQVSPASDIYSLGCVFFEMLTGEPPFSAETPIGLGMKHIYEPPPMDRLVVGEGTYASVKHLLSIMLEKRPERRPANAGTALVMFHGLEEVTETPFHITAPAGQDPDDVFGTPTVKARPASDPGVKVSDYLDSEGKVVEKDELIAEDAKEGKGEQEEGAVVEEPETEGRKKKKRNRKNRKKKKKKKQESLAAAQAAVAGEMAQEQQSPSSAPAPVPAAEPPVEAEPDSPLEAQQIPSHLLPPLRRREEQREAPAGPESAGRVEEADSEEEEVPGEELQAPEAREEEEVERVEARPDEAENEPVREITSADFGLTSESEPSRALEPVRYFSDHSLEDDLDWADPRPRRKSSPVGIFAWVVLVLGLIMTAFVLYALLKGGEQFPQAPEAASPGYQLECSVSSRSADSP